MADDGRVLLGWLSQREGERGTYFKGQGFGATSLLLTAGGDDVFTATGARVWRLYAVPDPEVVPPGSERGKEKGLKLEARAEPGSMASGCRCLTIGLRARTHSSIGPQRP